jgi:guanylate kinase
MNIFVISGPSGSGKTTLRKKLIASDPRLTFSRSFLTRALRADEVAGRDYLPPITRERFREFVARGMMLEWAEVHGNLYGTPDAEVARARMLGKDLVLDIDMQGAEQVREKDIGAHFIYTLPPSRDVLCERLRGRGDTAPVDIEQRLANAAAEMRYAERADTWIENDHFDKAFAALTAFILLVRTRVRPDPRRFRNQEVLNRVLSTFSA